MRHVAVGSRGGSCRVCGAFSLSFVWLWSPDSPGRPRRKRPVRRQSSIPDGVFTVTFSVSGDTSGCVFNATVNWGDGVITNVANIVDGQTLTHTYAAAGIYTVHITGAGTPTSPDAFCTFNPNTIVTVRTHVQT